MKKIVSGKSRIILLMIGLLMTAVGIQAQPKNDTASFTVFAVTANNELISFKPNSPQKIRSAVPITGLQPGETLLGIDFRPANGRLYGLGSTSRIYRIAPDGNVSAVSEPFTPALNGTDFGFDFNPTVDRIRIVSDTGQNLRAHPDTGQIVGIDGILNNGAMPPSTIMGITGAAYTNPDNDPNTGTILYDIDSNADLLVIQDPPNGGILKPVGPLGFNAGAVAGFDIGLNFGTAKHFGLAAIQTTRGTLLYSIDLATGQAIILGPIGNGGNLSGFAIDLTSSDRGLEE
jgi:hypothetical protein